MQHDAYKLALAQARGELEAANREAKALNLRISQLESVVAQLQALIDTAKPAPLTLFNPPLTPAIDAIPPPELKDSRTPLWKAIIAGLNGKKADFTVPDAISALERTGRFINSPNKKAIVRNALKQRSDRFKRLEEGHYCVIGFEGGKETQKAES